jgi:hypothetical protein
MTLDGHLLKFLEGNADNKKTSLVKLQPDYFVRLQLLLKILDNHIKYRRYNAASIFGSIKGRDGPV